MNFNTEYLSKTGINSLRLKFVEEFCEQTFQELSSDITVAKVFRSFDSHKQAKEHIFSVTFFSILIASKLNWTSKRVLKVVAQSALLHEFWLCTKEKELQLSNFRTTAESEEYQNHGAASIAEIKKRTDVDEAVIQILFQHHELNDGSGHPAKLTKAHIYPLAKILSLAEGFVEHAEKSGTEPYLELKSFFNEPKILERYDHDSLRCLLQCFIKEDDDTVIKETRKYA